MNKRIRKKFLKAAACYLGDGAPDGSIMRPPRYHLANLLPNGHPQQQRKAKRQRSIIWYGLGRGAYGKHSSSVREWKAFCVAAAIQFPAPAWKGGFYRFWRRPQTRGV